MTGGPRLGAVTASDLQASFRGEIYGDAATMTDAWFADHVARNDVDLARSPGWTVDGQLSAAALLAFRRDRAWVGGFGVVPAFRGRGLAGRYLADVLEIARTSGAATVELEVLANNRAAFALYERARFKVTGELIAWSRDPLPAASDVTRGTTASRDGPRTYAVAEVSALARVPATCWQREPRSVAAASPADLIVVGDATTTRAYAFVRRNDGARAAILDAGVAEARAPDAPLYDATSTVEHPNATAAIRSLLAELDRRYAAETLTLINEPPRGALHDALAASPYWREFARQFRMRAAL